MQKLFIDTYIDIIFAGSLNLYAMNQTESWEELMEFFDSFDNILCSTVTLIAVFLAYWKPIYIWASLYVNLDHLHEPHILEKYGVFYEEFDYRSSNPLKSFYTVI